MLFRSLVMFDDQATRFNARGRRLRPYEWKGILQEAFPNHEIDADVIGLVRCTNSIPDYVVTILTTNGRLRALLTRDTGVQVNLERFIGCDQVN